MTTFTKPLLVVDDVAGAQPSSGSVGFELQSSRSALLVSRMTTAQLNALTSVDGMIVYNTDTNSYALSQGGSWANFSPAAAQTQTFEITSPQLLGMFAAPVPLLPAPGAGKALIVTDFILEYIHNTTRYQNGGNILLTYSPNGFAASSPIDPALLTGFDASGLAIGTPVVTRRPIASIQNQAIALANQTAAFTAGDGTARVTLLYLVIPV